MHTPRAIRGLSLPEVAVVLITIGLLAAMATPRLATARDDAVRQALLDHTASLNRAVALYRWSNAGDAPALGATSVDPLGWSPLVRGGRVAVPPLNRYTGSMIVVEGSPAIAPSHAPGDLVGWVWDPQTAAIAPAGLDPRDNQLFHERPIP